MIAYKNGRRRVVRPGDADVSRIRLILTALIFALSGGLTVLCYSYGTEEGILSLTLPVYRALADCNSETASTDTLSEAPAELPMQSLTLTQVETLHASVAASAMGTEEEDAEGPRILIYHTHATEAYLQTGDSMYVESGKWRTKDQTKNVVAVGEALAAALKETYGISVLHDTANHEPPKLSTAYSRSLAAMLDYQREYPTLRVFIDVHRDAYATESVEDGVPRDYVTINGIEVARVMFVVGTGKGATGSGFAEMPDFDANYAFAKDISARLNGINAQFAREIRVKTGRYNQHVSNRCLLLEVGHNANTLSQALNAVPYLAEAIAGAIEADAAAATSALVETGVWTPGSAG